jgi:hypothetical protein
LVAAVCVVELAPVPMMPVIAVMKISPVSGPE